MLRSHDCDPRRSFHRQVVQQGLENTEHFEERIQEREHKDCLD